MTNGCGKLQSPMEENKTKLNLDLKATQCTKVNPKLFKEPDNRPESTNYRILHNICLEATSMIQHHWQNQWKQRQANGTIVNHKVSTLQKK